MRSQSLRDVLAAETRDVHERLHRHPDFAALEAGTIGRSDYACLMARMGGFYSALDRTVLLACKHLKGDLAGYRYRQRGPLFAERASHGAILPQLGSLPALAGAIYVADGAVLGGQILARSAGPGRAHAYWEWCAEQGASVWHQARGLIDRADRGPEARSVAVASAISVFRAFEVSVAPAEQLA